MNNFFSAFTFLVRFFSVGVRVTPMGWLVHLQGFPSGHKVKVFGLLPRTVAPGTAPTGGAHLEFQASQDGRNAARYGADPLRTGFLGVTGVAGLYVLANPVAGVTAGLKSWTAPVVPARIEAAPALPGGLVVAPALAMRSGSSVVKHVADYLVERAGR